MASQPPQILSKESHSSDSQMMGAKQADSQFVVRMLDNKPDVVDLDQWVDVLSSDSEIEFVCTSGPSEVQIVSQRNHKRMREALPGTETIENDDDRDVAITGEKTILDSQVFYPHFRFMCKLGTPCPKCFCFVCDVPVSQCDEWGIHSMARDIYEWRELRRVKRAKSHNILSQNEKANQC